MKILVTFYSRDGHSKSVGEKIASILGAEIDEIRDMKNRSGIVGWLVSGKDAATNKITEIENKIDPTSYDLVIIGTPIWVGTVTPAVRAYLKKYKLNKVAFYCTCDDKQTKAWADMEKLSGTPVATMEMPDKILKAGGEEFENKIKEFCEKINR